MCVRPRSKGYEQWDTYLKELLLFAPRCVWEKILLPTFFFTLLVYFTPCSIIFNRFRTWEFIKNIGLILAEFVFFSRNPFSHTADFTYENFVALITCNATNKYCCESRRRSSHGKENQNKVRWTIVEGGCPGRGSQELGGHRVCPATKRTAYRKGDLPRCFLCKTLRKQHT